MRKTISDPETSILIVDDSLQYADVLRRILVSAFGYRNVTTVEDTNSAEKLISDNPTKFQLLFVDYNFPCGRTGGELLASLKSKQLMEDKVAFLITSEPTVDNQRQATSAGALGVVAKPFDRGELKSQLEKAERIIQTDNMESF